MTDVCVICQESGNYLKICVCKVAMEYLVTAESEHGASMQFVVVADNTTHAIERANTELRCCNLTRWRAISAIKEGK